MAENEGANGNGCAGCKYCDDWECHRYPMVVGAPAHYMDGRWFDVDWRFPPSGTRCGEFDDGKPEKQEEA